jgi:hypothetical protein
MGEKGRLDMKRRIAAVLSVLASVLVAFPVLATTFTSQMTVTNNGSTNYAQTSLNYTINNTDLIARGLMSADGLDTTMRSGASNIPTMIADNATYFATSLLSHQSKTLTMLNGQSLTSHDIILGNGGNITTADSPSLVLGNNFTLSIGTSGHPVYIDMSLNNTLAYQYGAYKLWTQDSNVTFSVLNADDSVNMSISHILSTGEHYISVIATPTDLILMIDFGAYSELAASAANITTTSSITNSGTGAFPFDKIFYAAGRYWIFFCDGIYVRYASSADNYATSTIVATESDITTFRFYLDAAGYIHYVHVSSGNKYRRGIPNSNGTISWNTAEHNIPTLYSYAGMLLADNDGVPYIIENRPAWYAVVRKGYSNQTTFNGSWLSDNWTATGWDGFYQCSAVSATMSGGGLYINLNWWANSGGGGTYYLSTLNKTGSGTGGGTWNVGALLTSIGTSIYGISGNKLYTKTFSGGITDLGNITNDTISAMQMSVINSSTLKIYWSTGGIVKSKLVTGSNITAIEVFDPLLISSTQWITQPNGNTIAYLQGPSSPYKIIFPVNEAAVAETTSFSGKSLLNSSSNITWLGTGVPYCGAITVSVNGTSVLQYQPAAIISGTTMPDRSAYSNTGTISWGTFPSDVLITLNAPTLSLTPGDIPPGVDEQGWQMVNGVPTQPNNLFTGGGTSWPGGAEVNTLATDTMVPYYFWVTILAFGTAIAAACLVYGATHNAKMGRNGSLFVMWLVFTVVYTLWYIGGGGVVEGWPLIPVGIWGIFLMLWFNPFKTAAN